MPGLLLTSITENADDGDPRSRNLSQRNLKERHFSQGRPLAHAQLTVAVVHREPPSCHCWGFAGTPNREVFGS